MPAALRATYAPGRPCADLTLAQPAPNASNSATPCRPSRKFTQRYLAHVRHHRYALQPPRRNTKEKDETMDLQSWISIFMALIAVASAIVTYAVFRSATDPTVIVYAQPDLQRQSIVNLIVENIGRGAAHGIHFLPSRPLPGKAFSIAIPEKMPDQMQSGPIVNGIPFLAPGQRLLITWGQYGGLLKYLGNDPIRIEACCYRSLSKNIFSKKLRSNSTLDIRMFETSESTEHGYGPNLVKELKVLNSTLKTLEDRLG